MSSCSDKVLEILRDEYGYDLDNVSDETKKQIKVLCDSKPPPTPGEVALAIHLDFLLTQVKQKLKDKGIVPTKKKLQQLKGELALTHSVKSAIKKIFPDLSLDS